MVLYLKYRPSTLSELDCEGTALRLGKILTSSFAPHAYLFTGPKGTGKTSAARIIAKILNCAKNPMSQKEGLPDPCNQCESCISISSGRNMDILEIDAASNRGIDEIRDLREKIKLSPVAARFKVYIIDEVHMLTNEAFNALLKTLEEPPAHAVFILATTEPDKLLPTITSRCLKINFLKATSQEILHALNRVVGGEKIEIGADILQKIADSSDGSFRDGTKMLEQIIAEGVTTAEKMEIFLGRQDISVETFISLLSKKDLKTLLGMVVTLGQQGADFRVFITEALEILHKIFLFHFDVLNGKVDKSLVQSFSKEETSALIKLLTRVFIEIKGASKAELPLEIAIVQWCENKT